MFLNPLRPLSTAAGVLLLALGAGAKETQGLVLPFKSVSIASPVIKDVVEAVLVEEGDTVKEGQVLVQLRHAKEELFVAEAEKQIENSSFVAKGFETLANEKMGSREQALKARTELELYKIRLAMAQEQLKEKTVRTPIAGIVVKKHKEAGESVDQVEKLIDIVNIDRVFAQFYLEPELMQVLKEGQEIAVRIPVLNTQMTGKIDFIDPRIDAASNTFRIKVLMENGDHKIKAGMRGSADFGKAPAVK